jgi:hypothetical protein
MAHVYVLFNVSVKNSDTVETITVITVTVNCKPLNDLSYYHIAVIHLKSITYP